MFVMCLALRFYLSRTTLENLRPILIDFTTKQSQCKAEMFYLKPVTKVTGMLHGSLVYKLLLACSLPVTFYS
jgi:hypothetical protein